MNTELLVFSYEGNQVRTVQVDGEPWWVLRDVCQVLDLTSPARVAERLEEDEVSQAHLIDSIGRNQETLIVSEAGLYSVIIRSDKPDAKQFKRWVTHEVLPSIRKHGAYVTNNKLDELMSDPDTWVRLINELKAERDQRQQLEAKAVVNQPKVIFADAVSVSDGTILIGELAKILKGNGIDIGQNRLYERLRADGYLIRRKGSDYNAPTQKAMELGLFKVKETAITHADGHVTISKTTKVTGKGQQYFINQYLGAGASADLEPGYQLFQ